MLRSNVAFDYSQLEQKVKTLHPVRAKKFLEILNVVKDCIQKKIRPTYRIIHEATAQSSKTIAAFWKWMKEQGLGLKDLFLTRVEEVAQKIQSETKTTYRALSKKLKTSFTTISKAFKLLKKIKQDIQGLGGHTEDSSGQNQLRPLNYDEAVKLFHALSPIEKNRYYDIARQETGSEDKKILEKFAVGIFAKTCPKSSNSSESLNVNSSRSGTDKPQNDEQTFAFKEAADRILKVYNSCLETHSKKYDIKLHLAPSLSRKEKRALQKLLKMGFTLEDIESVIKYKADEWLNDKNMASNFRLKTLLKPDYFRAYLNHVKIVTYKEKSKYKPIKDGTKIQYNSKIYTVLDGQIYTENGAIIPYDLWRLVKSGKAKIISDKEE